MLGLAALIAVQPGAAVAATIADLLRNPARYEGATVRLSGFVDQCTPYECHLCPTAGLPDVKTCVVLDRWALATAADDSFDEEDVAKSAELLLDEFYRFTRVTVRAKADFHSKREVAAARPPDPTGLVDYFSCGSSRHCHEVDEVFLIDVAVQKLHERGSPFDGPLTGDHAKPLEPLSPDDDAALRAAFTPRIYGSLEGPGVRTYGAPGYSSAWLCMQASRWPALLGHVARSPGSDLQCWEAIRFSKRDSWRFDKNDKPFVPD